MTEDFLKIYNQTNEKMKALNLCEVILGWDAQTQAPKGCFEYRAQRLGTLGEMEYTISTSKEYLQAIDYLYQHKDQLDSVMSHEIAKVKKDIDKTKKIPQDEFVAYAQLMGISTSTYFDAKSKGDYDEFKPVLEKIIDYKKKYVKWIATDQLKGYDVLLDEFETGMTTVEYDRFFDVLKEKLVPFVKEVTKKKLKFNDKWLTKSYPIDKQIAFTDEIRKIMNYDLNRGVIKQSEHPFTTGTHSGDVRVTVHYYENNFLSAIFSAIHEMGHATYEQQVDPKLDETLSGGGASMGMHESQSRFYENIIGRSKAFCEMLLPKLQEYFPKQLGKVTLEDFYKGVNLAKRSFIRTEADELTYALHIMLRYDLEKKMIGKKVDVDKLRLEWNRLAKKYLGLTVKDDRDGILQDMHWSDGSIGYFPTYALGSAYSAQIFHKMSQELDVDKIVLSGNLKGINDYLKEKIHKFGSSMDPKDILFNATGEQFNPNYFVDYLIDKYSKIYEL